MNKITLPFTDAELFLTPPWSGSTGAGSVLLVVLLALIPAALTLLYRYELNLVSRRVARTLLGLRFAAILVLLFLVSFHPVVGRNIGEDLPGRVLIAVDRSESMDITDIGRSTVEKLRLALALRIAEDLAPSERIRKWITRVESGQSPSANDQDLQNRICKRVNKLTRAQISRRVLASDGVKLVEAMGQRHRVEVAGFATETWAVSADRVDGLLETEPKRADDDSPSSKRDSRTATDLRQPLLRALEPSNTGEKLLGIVILTDGRHNRGPSPIAKATELGQQSVPIYPVVIGSPAEPPDIAIAGLKAPPAVFKGADVVVETRVKIGGLPKQTITVELQRPGQPSLEEPIAHDGTDRYYTVRFTTRLEQPGSQALTVVAKPVPGELREDNNRRTAVVNVADDKARVLIVDGEARWEYHYLAAALARDPSIRLDKVVFGQPRVDKISEAELAKIGNPARSLPPDPDALAPYDCIILGDVSPEQFPLPDRTRLEKYVADRGGTLVVAAGKRWMPASFAREQDDPLRRLLPIEEPAEIRATRGFPATLTTEGRATPFLQLDNAPEKSAEIWAGLPEQYWGTVGRAKPGATSLAYAADNAAFDGKAGPDGPERERGLIVRQHYGFGQVLYVGLDSTWRWRYKIGDELHHRFWGQVIRWAATERPLIAGDDRVRFGTREPVYRPGQEVEIVARLGELVHPLGPNALAGARIFRQGGGDADKAVALVPLKSRAAQPRVLEGRLRDLAPGTYAIELAIPDLDKSQANAAPRPQAHVTVAAEDSDELVELAANVPLMEELANRSGGRVFRPENALELVDLLKHQSVTRWHHEETRLWEWWPTLVVVLFSLSLEWIVRKWVGLP